MFSRFVCEFCQRGFLREKLYTAHKETCSQNAAADPNAKPRGNVSGSGGQWKRRPGRPRRKMITVTESSMSRNRPALQPKPPASTRHGRQRRPPARYADAADESEVMGRLEEVVEASTKEEIDQVEKIMCFYLYVLK